MPTELNIPHYNDDDCESNTTLITEKEKSNYAKKDTLVLGDFELLLQGQFKYLHK